MDKAVDKVADIAAADIVAADIVALNRVVDKAVDKVADMVAIVVALNKVVEREYKLEAVYIVLAFVLLQRE